MAAAIGRQYGKSTLVSLRLARRAIECPGRYYWVAPIFPQARVQFERFVADYRALIRNVNRSHYEATVVGGSVIRWAGSDTPESLKGDTLDGAVLDECGTMHSHVWGEVVRPMLAVRDGWADLIGTPKGRNWWHDVWTSARTMDGWTQIHKASNDSPYFPQGEFENARASLPERIFRQEYLAEFLADDSDVFRGINDCVQGSLQDPQKGHSYIMGVDVAKHVDWTVVTVMDTHAKHVVAFERWNQIDWPMQVERIANISAHYNGAMIVLDATGAGDPINDALVERGLSVIPFKFSNQTKTQLIQKLAMSIERREVTFPEIPQLLAELRMFAFERLPSGLIRYGAPQGQHDDCVISLALALYGETYDLGIGGVHRVGFSR